MFWLNFLHIYQPTDQSDEILERVVNESYRPLFKGFLKIKNLKINLNINAALTELLVKKGYTEVIENIKKLAQTQRLEFTETAKYHALLPFLEEEDIRRQIIENYQTNKKYFGESYQPVCFFPPEMAYSSKVGKVVSDMGYKVILLDEISYDGGKNYPPKDRLFKIKKTNNLMVVFRERRVSNCIMSAIIRNKKEFHDLIKDDLNKNVYLCTAMDGETFGHHRPGLEKCFFKIISADRPKHLFFRELSSYFKIEGESEPVKSTWASSSDDIEKGIQFYSWKNPKNKVHQFQWAFVNYLLRLANKKRCEARIQEKIDKAVASDQFFWASGEPWWSIEMIEKGAWAALQALKILPSIKKSEIKIGQDFYKNILSTAFWWQRSGKIGEMARKYREAVKIPFKERTFEQGKPEVYFAFLKTMEKKMFEAAKRKNFEKAIFWRDAIFKLETKKDIYDAIHAVDVLRSEIADLELRKLMDRYKEKYKKIQPGQPEIRKI